MNIIRHGEVILKQIDKIPNKATELEQTKSYIAGHSESGHHHVLTATQDFRVFEMDGKTYLDIPLEAKLTHQKSGDAEKYGINADTMAEV